MLEQFIRQGKDVNVKSDVHAYLKGILRVDDSKNLHEKLSRHPYHLYVPLKDIGATFNYLIECGLERTNIYEAMWILLYPV